jgi:predicted  nucleic acid-binding Zn-ribbon protein
MKTKKRYFTRQEIVEDIKKAKARAKRLKVEADALDATADDLFKQDFRMWEDAKFTRAQAEKARNLASRVETVTLKHLGEKLSEWDTMALPGLDDGDRSIQA